MTETLHRHCIRSCSSSSCIRVISSHIWLNMLTCLSYRCLRVFLHVFPFQISPQHLIQTQIFFLCRSLVDLFVSCFTIQSVRCPQPVKKNISDWNLSSIQLLGFERSLDVRMMAPSTLTAKGSECQRFYQTKLVFGTWSGTLEAKMKGDTFSNFYFVPYMKYINTINYIRNLISDYNVFVMLFNISLWLIKISPACWWRWSMSFSFCWKCQIQANPTLFIKHFIIASTEPKCCTLNKLRTIDKMKQQQK